MLVARHPNRPNTLDYIERLFTGWDELHGDRRFADDHAIVAGFARVSRPAGRGDGHQKGRDTKQKIFRNFGYARPEGYRKALRVMQMAQKFGRPIIVFIDTPAAYPGMESEERGVAEAIALNLREMMMIEVPIIVIVCGEGGSGGALGIAIGDRVLMQEFSVYSVIPPEGCAAILWRDANRKVEAAAALKITAPDLLALGLIDGIIPSRSAARTTTTRGDGARRPGAAALARGGVGAERRRTPELRATTSSAGWAKKARRSSTRTPSALSQLPTSSLQRPMAVRNWRSAAALLSPSLTCRKNRMKSTLLWQHLPCDDAVGPWPRR